MSQSREIRCYDYVNHPYERVRDALVVDPVAVFHAATQAASARAHSVAVALRVELGGVEIAKEVNVSVDRVTEEPGKARSPAQTRLDLQWQAAKSPRLFPFMRAELMLYRLTATETQLDLLGHYEPPLGPLGRAIDTLVGHRIAEASVHRFLADVAEHLRRTLGQG
jgi:hypothetical protein